LFCDKKKNRFVLQDSKVQQMNKVIEK